MAELEDGRRKRDWKSTSLKGITQTLFRCAPDWSAWTRLKPGKCPSTIKLGSVTKTDAADGSAQGLQRNCRSRSKGTAKLPEVSKSLPMAEIPR